MTIKKHICIIIWLYYIFMKFEILKETEKAIYIKIADKELWMPKSLVKKNGELSKKGEDIVAMAKTNAEKQQEKEGVEVDFSKADVETEKAYGFKVDFLYKNPTAENDGEVKFTKTFYMPKSQIKENGKIAKWVVDKIINELWEIESKYSGSCLDGYRGHIEAGKLNFLVKH